MNFSDFIILYLAIGAPFGVQYFLSHRDDNAKVWHIGFRSVCIALAWFVRLFQLATRYRRERFSLALDESAETEKTIAELQKSLSANFVTYLKDDVPQVSLFDFREVIERYVGLTQAVRDADEDALPSEHESAIFRVEGRSEADLKIAAQVVHRQNVRRLRRHQLTARADFLEILDLFRSAKLLKVNVTETWKIGLDLAEVLEDNEAARAIRKKIFTINSIGEKIYRPVAVKDTEPMPQPEVEQEEAMPLTATARR